MDIQEINRHLNKIIGTMNEGLLLVAPDGTILMVNKAFEELTGYGQGELVGRPCTLHPAQLRCLRNDPEKPERSVVRPL
jgi:two-component system, NtrC family, response regulator HydG